MVRRSRRTNGAALAFYSVLSMAPLLVIVIALAGSIFGAEAARGELVHQIESLVGPEGGRAIEDMIVSASRPEAGRWASVIGIVILLIGASGVFNELQDALDTIWRVQPKPGRAIWTIIRDRIFSVTMVVGTGFLLIVSLAVSAALNALTRSMTFVPPNILIAMNSLISLVVISFLFAIIFKYVPDVVLRWRVVWIGAIVTGVLFTIGKSLLGIYLGRAAVGSAYGAAGSLVAFAVWIYYSAQILLFGAEITFIYAQDRVEQPPPTPHAEPISGEQLHSGSRPGILSSARSPTPDG